MGFLFNIGDRVRVKYYMDSTINKNNVVYEITNTTHMDMTDGTKVNVYLMEAMVESIIKEIYIDELYLVYDGNYLRELKLKKIING